MVASLPRVAHLVALEHLRSSVALHVAPKQASALPVGLAHRDGKRLSASEGGFRGDHTGAASAHTTNSIEAMCRTSSIRRAVGFSGITRVAALLPTGLRTMHFPSLAGAAPSRQSPRLLCPRHPAAGRGRRRAAALQVLCHPLTAARQRTACRSPPPPSSADPPVREGFTGKRLQEPR